MVKAPVESMKYGGILWFPDLTIADPYFLLPLFNTLSLWLQVLFVVGSIMVCDEINSIHSN